LYQSTQLSVAISTADPLLAPGHLGLVKAYYAPRIGIDHKGDVDEARPGVDVGEIDYPQSVRPIHAKLPVDLVERAWRLGIADGRDRLLPSTNAGQPHCVHQSFDRALGDFNAFAPQLVPDLARAVEADAGLVNAPDLIAHVAIPARTGGTLGRIGKTGCMFVIGGRGDCQFAADRLDTQVLAMPQVNSSPDCSPILGISMNAIIISRGGRAPPSQNTPMPCPRSR